MFTDRIVCELLNPFTSLKPCFTLKRNSRGGIQMQVADWDKPKTYVKKCVRLVTINESVRCYYKEDIHLADGCSSRASYSCFTLIISTCRVMDWKCSHTGSASLPGCSVSTPLLSASHKHSHAHKKQTSRANTVRQHDRRTSPRYTLRYALAFLTDTGVEPACSAASSVN